MNILVLDTSTTSASFCIAHYEASTRSIGISAQHDTPRVRNHEHLLLATFTKLCDMADIAYRQIDCIAVGLGPGSFTGLRIGLAFAKAYALSTPVPIIGSSLFNYIDDEADCTAALAPCTQKKHFFSLRTKEKSLCPLGVYSKKAIQDALQKNCSRTTTIATLGAVDDPELYPRYIHAKQLLQKAIAPSLLNEVIEKLNAKNFLSMHATPDYLQSPQTDKAGVMKRPQFE